jgi:hypothetical protein
LLQLADLDIRLHKDIHPVDGEELVRSEESSRHSCVVSSSEEEENAAIKLVVGGGGRGGGGDKNDARASWRRGIAEGEDYKQDMLMIPTHSVGCWGGGNGTADSRVWEMRARDAALTGVNLGAL